MPLYPGGSIRSREWRELRYQVLEQANFRCEGTPQFPDCRAVNNADHPETGAAVVLTVAHMDQNPLNNDRANLKALCQRCHNAWDAPQRARHAAATRRARAPHGDLFDDGRAGEEV